MSIIDARERFEMQRYAADLQRLHRYSNDPRTSTPAKMKETCRAITKQFRENMQRLSEAWIAAGLPTGERDGR